MLVASSGHPWECPTARALLSTCPAAGLSALSFRCRYSGSSVLSRFYALGAIRVLAAFLCLVSLACIPVMPDGLLKVVSPPIRLRASCSTEREWVGFFSPRSRCVDSALGDGTWVSAHALETGGRDSNPPSRLSAPVVPVTSGRHLGMP